MKKLLLFIALLSAVNLSAQTTQKQVGISKKIISIVNKIKANEYFDFITKHDKMYEIYDCNGNLNFYKINGENYFIKIDTDNNVSIFYNNGEYHFNLVDNDLVGHGFTLNTREKELTTYYFQNNKTTKKVSNVKS